MRALVLGHHPGRTEAIMSSRRLNLFFALLLTGTLYGCGATGSSAPSSSPSPHPSVSVSGASSPLDTGASRTFTATVTNSSNTAVSWSVVETGGGSITPAGIYTAPATPGTYTVKATAQADSSASATAAVPVVIPERSIAGYNVGVDYHAYDTDFIHTAFITFSNQPSGRHTVHPPLQGR